MIPDSTVDTERNGWLTDLGSPVVAYGGAGLSAGDAELSGVERALVRGVTRDRPPVITLVPTASGDDADLIERFRAAVEQVGGEPHVLSLFHRTDAPYDDVLDRTDLVYVTGGAVANLAELWRLHELDEAIMARWRDGVPVAGSSAGALIWSRGGVTTSFGDPAPWADGLGVLPWSLCPHWDTQPERAELFREDITRGVLAPGWGIDEQAAGVFVGDELVLTLRDVPGQELHRID